MKQRKKAQSRNLLKQKFVVEQTSYEQKYPFTTKPTLANYNILIHKTHNTTRRNNVFVSTVTAKSLEEVVERLTHKKQNIRGLKRISQFSIHRSFDVRYENHNHDFGYLTKLERKKQYEELKQIVADTSNAVVNG